MDIDKPLTLGLIVTSTRPVRAGGQLGVQLRRIAEEAAPDAVVQVVDLRQLALPFLDEPRMAATGLYEHAHTRAWARTVAGFDAVVVLTPQYNWGYPAPIKNAVDYLFAEWRGLPGLVVSYGTHGGNKANDQLSQVLGRVGIDLVPGVCVEVPKTAYDEQERFGDAAAVAAPYEQEIAGRIGELLARAGERAV